MAHSPRKGSIQLQASSSTQLVEQLQAMSHPPKNLSLSAFMIHFATQLMNKRGELIRTDTPDHFIDDLIRASYIRISPEK
ncbi:hypothetical protein EXU85_24440 [Spirosoma sp. KCTC 42546]|uniref:hypothetical protein n=1 Tax=Spirosoma sp. KCTC 42546 TaxID=2520506 RepID=UPI001157D05E|nr:hypothetical protein [Spirosoma sp. KCTC 42546]QDK81588.1 hypothetical protein EXU85_24440 [Spirosoma sp. KCTC 42546]